RDVHLVRLVGRIHGSVAGRNHTRNLSGYGVARLRRTALVRVGLVVAFLHVGGRSAVRNIRVCHGSEHGRGREDDRGHHCPSKYFRHKSSHLLSLTGSAFGRPTGGKPVRTGPSGGRICLPAL